MRTMATSENISNAPKDARRSAPASAIAKVYERAVEHHRAGRLMEAVREYARVLRRAPNAEVYNNLGVALRALDKPHGAAACYRRALALKPEAANIYTNLGNVLRDLGDTARALEAHRRAIKYAPQSPQALFNAALALRATGQVKAALGQFNAALKIEPAYATCRVERAITLLQLGDWPRGFAELENRFALPGRDPRRKGLALWDGAPLKGASILVNYEGNEAVAIQFSRFAAALKSMGARVVMECPEHLIHLFAATAAIDATILPRAPITNVDVQIPLLSLPSRLKVSLDTLPAEIPYLSRPKSTVAPPSVLPHTRLAVGLAWSGRGDAMSQQTRNTAQNMMLEDFAEIFAIPNLQFFALEHSSATDDIARLGLQALIENADASIVDVANLAAVIEQLDLVICDESSLCAHVAGALGKPVWMVAGPQADWCWLMGREDSPWYPSLRLFRHASPHDAANSVSAIRKALMDILAQGA